MALSGRLLAQLGSLALRDADAMAGDGIAWPPPPPMTEAVRREVERLRVLGWRLFYKAREAGFVEQSYDGIFGEEEPGCGIVSGHEDQDPARGRSGCRSCSGGVAPPRAGGSGEAPRDAHLPL